MERIFRLLKKIKKNYGVYIGYPSLTNLSLFLSGYECAIYDIFSERCNFNSQFQLFVQTKKNLTNCSKHWSEIIIAEKTTDESFDEFFEYVEEFFEKAGYGSMSSGSDN